MTHCPGLYELPKCKGDTREGQYIYDDGYWQKEKVSDIFEEQTQTQLYLIFFSIPVEVKFPL